MFSRLRLAPIAIPALLMAAPFLLAMWGCSGPLPDRNLAMGDSFFHTIRPVGGDTSQLLRNAHYFRLMGRPELALKQLELVRQQEPRNLKVLNELARGYEDAGDFERAQKLYQEGLAVDGSNQALINNLCFSYYLAGKLDQAESCFRQALAQNPGNLAARNNLGLLLCRLGRTEEAARLWREAEGEVAAQQKVSQVLAALGLPASSPYAKQQPPPAAPRPTAAVQPGEKPVETRQLAARSDTASPAAPAPPAPPPRTDRATQPQPAKRPAAVPPASAQTRTQAPAQEKSPIASAAIAGPSATPGPTPAKVAAVRAAAPPESQPLPQAKSPTPARKPATPAATPAPTPSPVAGKPPLPKPHSAPALAGPTAAEMSAAGIEVRNGAGIVNLAHKTRTLLTEAGFQVVEIGNYRDFGVEQTRIYYRPAAEKVARALNSRFFPQARLESFQEPAADVDVKVVLGKELLGRPLVAATPSPVVAPATDVSRPTVAPPPHPVPAAPVVAAPSSPPLAPASTAAASRPKVPPAKGVAVSVLSAAELNHTAIDLRNGAGAADLAHQVRSRLSEEGFRVSSIGNYRDFGVEQTLIYYRPGAQKVAQALTARFFPIARMEQSSKLPAGIDIKIIMGKDLVQRHDLMAKLEE